MRRETPDLAPLQVLALDAEARGFERVQIALDALDVQVGQAELIDEVIPQLFQRPADAGCFQKLQQLVLPDELLVAGHGALLDV